MLDMVKSLVLGCAIWQADYILKPLDATNNRIYTALHTVNPELAGMYQDWLKEQRLNGMFSVAETQVNELITAIRAGLVRMNPIAAAAQEMDKWEEHERSLEGLVLRYGLGGVGSPCRGGITLTWVLDSALATTKRAEFMCPAAETPQFFTIFLMVAEDGMYYVAYETSYDATEDQNYICDGQGLLYVSDKLPSTPALFSLPYLGPFNLNGGKYKDCSYWETSDGASGYVECPTGEMWSCSVASIAVGPNVVSCDDEGYIGEIQCEISSHNEVSSD